MKYKFLIPTIVILIVLISAALIVLSARNRSKTSPNDRLPSIDVPSSIDQNSTANTPPVQTKQPDTKILKAQDISGVVKEFQFSVKIPSSWQAEVVTAIESINLYDPNVTDDNNLEKSQIFIRHFKANSFLTLETVNIINRQELTINNRPAVRYEIEKKSGVANFPNQPSWRNTKHVVTDIRVSDDNPSVFYVIAKRPDLADEIYEKLLQSIEPVAKETSLTPPVKEFQARVTKKPFGILIDPKTSPVQPERFSGYHTGVDVEYEDVKEDVPIIAIADGTVVRSTTASGYGGVLVIRHSIKDQEKLVVYGHLDPKSLVKNGSNVKTGEPIGVLGEGGTGETDGERKHLHFAILEGESVDLRGYVDTKDELAQWADPTELLNN